MKSAIKTQKLRIGGMTCVNCENTIEKKLRNTAGIEKVSVSYNTGTAEIEYDTDIISLKGIHKIIERLDYTILTDKEPASDKAHVAGVLLLILAVYILMKQLGLTNLANIFPTAEAGMSYGMLFLIGVFTSVHCIAMCGGINLSQCIPQQAAQAAESRLASLRPSFLYNLGRVISYTVVGGIVGALGSVISFSGSMKGFVQLIAGVFMVIMGINMLGLFPWLRKFNPRMPRIFARQVNRQKSKSNSPLYVGLLNGFMPCGPLQAMQIYALSTGSPVKGAISMLLFSLGTVPLMFGLGALSSVLSKKFTHKIMTVGAALVVVLGLSMFSNGWILSNLPMALPVTAQTPAEPAAAPVMENDTQIVTSALLPGRYPAITVQAGIPVRWTINAQQGTINGCNNRIFIPEYGVEHQFQVGENVIEFTPTKTGTFVYSCWMGMIRSSITVTDTAVAPDANLQPEQGAPSTPSAPSFNPSIPTDSIITATMEDDVQKVKIDLTDDGFSPAVLVVQAGIDVEWVINNISTKEGNDSILVPAYNTQLPLEPGETILYLFPTADLEFSTGNNAFYGYVKVVDDLNTVNTDSIKAELASYQTQAWSTEIGNTPPCCS